VTALVLCVAACAYASGAFACLAFRVMSVSLHQAMKWESNVFPLEFPWRSNFLSPLKLPR
jgi:hypothetical protein